MARGSDSIEDGIGRPLGHQVIFGIAGFMVLIVSIVGLAIGLVVKLNHRETHLNSGDAAYLTAVQSASLEAKAIANDQRGFLLSGDTTFVAEARTRLDGVNAGLSRASAAATSIAESKAIEEASDGFTKWYSTFQHEIETYLGGDHEAAISASLGPDRDLRKSYEQSLETAQTVGESKLHAADHSVAAAATHTIRLLIIGMIVALAIAICIGEWLLRTIVRPLFHLVDVLYR
jgi:methyl-accepting chemotaxis protein